MADKQSARALRQARDLIDIPRCWTKGSYARAASGAETYSSSESAVSRCAVGALYAAARAPTLDRAWRYACEYLTATMPEEYNKQSLSAFNDAPTTTHKDIMAWFDRAIALAEAAPDRAAQRSGE